MVQHSLAISAVGSPETVEGELRVIIEETRPDELILTGHFHDHAARLHSFEIAAQIRDRLAQSPEFISDAR
jgi:alkanesulfonate monooxygenase SsuD/methylene tetrahydromethanopterin reductase-like flavin-dependent oxidoreductase (luciferase family)